MQQLISQSEQLEEQTKKLQELDQVKSTFFANISHEFRTPLTLILNSLSDRMATAKASEDKRTGTTGSDAQKCKAFTEPDQPIAGSFQTGCGAYEIIGRKL